MDNTVWGTVATILATGAVMILGNWAQRYWARKREVSDAKRKYRENVVIPIKEALTGLGNNLERNKFPDTVYKAKEEGNLTDVEGLEELEKSIESLRRGSMVETLLETIPLIATITSEDTREFLRKVFLEAAVISPTVSEEIRKRLKITDEEMGAKLNLAYKKLEDYVTLTD